MSSLHVVSTPTCLLAQSAQKRQIDCLHFSNPEHAAVYVIAYAYVIGVKVPACRRSVKPTCCRPKYHQ